MDGCPVLGCPVACDFSNQDVCPEVPDPDNPHCPVPNICVDRQIDIFGGHCNTVCPMSCPEGQEKCPGGYDERGCQLPDTCMPPTPVSGKSNLESA